MVGHSVRAARRAATGRRSVHETIRRRLPERAINVVLLERPLSGESLVSAISSAMRARQKQFEIRDPLASLVSERARLTTLLDALPVGGAFVNSDGSTLLSNPEFRCERPRRVAGGSAAADDERAGFGGDRPG